MNRLSGKICIITGASLGIGQACANLLSQEDAKVVLTDVKNDEGEAAAEQIRRAGGAALYLHHDVREEEAWEEVFAKAASVWGKVNVLINNAGVGIGCPPDEQTIEQWRFLMAVNLEGVFLGTKHAIRTMKNSGGESIINLSSIEGLVGDPNLGAYNASKGGVTLYTKSVALYCAREQLGIRVNAIHPGYIWTPMVENYLRQSGDVDAGRKALDAMHPIGHVGEPDDIAYGAVYLASDESKFVTGSSLVIDGGYTAQ